MENLTETKHKIKKVKSAGKYIELWFEDSDRETRDFCEKWYIWDELISNANLNHRVCNHGHVGLLISIDEKGNITNVGQELSEHRKEYWEEWREKSQKLHDFLQKYKDNSTEEKFLGIPDSWYEAMKFRCANGHVSSMILKSEGLGVDMCLKCQAPARLTFPTDISDFEDHE